MHWYSRNCWSVIFGSLHSWRATIPSLFVGWPRNARSMMPW